MPVRLATVLIELYNLDYASNAGASARCEILAVGDARTVARSAVGYGMGTGAPGASCVQSKRERRAHRRAGLALK
jgi:hypothetical protein